MKLRKPCQHDKYDAHTLMRYDGRTFKEVCPGGEFLSEGELITVLGRCAHGEMTYEDFRTWADRWLDDHRAQPRESLQ